MIPLYQAYVAAAKPDVFENHGDPQSSKTFWGRA